MRLGGQAGEVMQTALGVRETVMKIIDVMIYVIVYFFGALLLVATFQTWLVLPFIIWLSLYILAMKYFLPKMAAISKRQA